MPSAFNSSAYVLAMASEAGVSPDKFQVTSIGFETVVGISLSDAVTLDQLTSALTAIAGVKCKPDFRACAADRPIGREIVAGPCFGMRHQSSERQ